ncbi:hypothetical protein Y032_0162g3426 [Ancylostoma ceylanicum]|nr:hypothetical protein Y032_0162g3426 [Ancylostoma ceylanicum]
MVFAIFCLSCFADDAQHSRDLTRSRDCTRLCLLTSFIYKKERPTNILYRCAIAAREYGMNNVCASAVPVMLKISRELPLENKLTSHSGDSFWDYDNEFWNRCSIGCRF